MTSSRDVPAGQWGVAIGLLMFCFVSLCGIAFQVDPFAIAQRAICSAIVTCFVAQLTVRIMAMTLSRRR